MLTPDQIDTIFTEAHNADGSRGFRYIVARAIYAQGLKDAAEVCEAKALRCEKEAQAAIDSGELDDVSAIRSTAWQISVCAAAILALGKENQ